MFRRSTSYTVFAIHPDRRPTYRGNFPDFQQASARGKDVIARGVTDHYQIRYIGHDGRRHIVNGRLEGTPPEIVEREGDESRAA